MDDEKRPPTPAPRRLLEVDFLRGASILVIFWNHLLLLVQTSGYLQRSPFRIHYGFSDSAAIFVFFSGFVSGIVYDKQLELKGFVATQVKGLKRAGQIYGAQLLTLGILITCAFLWPGRGSLDSLHHQLEDFARHPVSEGIGLVSLQSCLDYVDILPFYVVAILLVPLTLLGFRKNPSWTLFLSASVYLSMQVLRALNYTLWMPDWFVNPFAWQVLFVLGTYLGFRWRHHSLGIRKSKPLAAFAFAVVLFSFLKIPSIQSLLVLHFHTGGIPQFASLAVPFIQKDLLEPVFFLHFLCLGYLGWMFAPQFKKFAYTSFARPFVIVGQHSLLLYCVATVLEYALCHFVVKAGGSAWSFLAGGALGWCAILGASMALWFRPEPRRSALTPAGGQSSSAIG